MRGTIKLTDFRCFTADKPAIFELGPGFTSFIGPNNAGKSTLIRSLFELRSAFVFASNTFTQNPQQFASQPGFGLDLPQPITDRSEIVSERPNAQLEFEVKVASSIDQGKLFVQTAHWKYNGDGLAIASLRLSDGRALGQTQGDAHSASCNGAAFSVDGEWVGFTELQKLLKAMCEIQYFGPFRNAVNEGAGTHYDLALGTSFISQWHQWKTGANKQQNRDVLRVTEDIRRLIGVGTLEINASNELKTLQISIDGRPHKLAELGAGISQLIVVLGNALVRRPSYIVIDEPETHLHPALQTDFLTSLASYAREGILFATHSIGLARTADACYSVQQTNSGSVVRPFESTPHYAEFLGSLGIAALQDIGWDRVLLVEGSHDVRTFQQFLRLLNLDRRTVILPLGGTSMIHGGTTEQLSEIVRLGSSVFAVIDSEKDSATRKISKERLAFQANCMQLGIQCLVTERRATENYLPDRAIKTSLGQTFSELDAFSLPGDVFWGKSQNWKAAREMTADELKATDVGQFLTKLSEKTK